MPDTGVRVWIARGEKLIMIFTHEPQFDRGIWILTAGRMSFVNDDFEVAVPPGECRRFRLCEVEDGE